MRRQWWGFGICQARKSGIASKNTSDNSIAHPNKLIVTVGTGGNLIGQARMLSKIELDGLGNLKIIIAERVVEIIKNPI